MSVSGSSGSTSAALGAVTNPTAGYVQQRIAAKLLKDELENEAAMVSKLIESTETVSSSAAPRSRIDVRI